MVYDKIFEWSAMDGELIGLPAVRAMFRSTPSRYPSGMFFLG